MNILTLSGWGQPHDALAVLAPHARHLDYAHAADAHGVFAQMQHADVLIGWSLGGQLAARAVAHGVIAPRLLVLIAAPFQFVASPERALGMKRDLYTKFHDNYARNPARTLDKAWELVLKGDEKETHVRSYMEKHDKAQALQRDWLRWLHLLDGYSCDTLDFSRFPKTLLIHGEGDAVVDVQQQEQFAQKIPHAHRLTLPGCGHAPHWHDTPLITQWIAGHV